jgi:23S rRNA pseudouridine2605 synthase
MLNKPRGLVTTASDERGRETVYQCLAGAGLPFLGPVGRLDQASEGLLLFTNDTAWAARLTSPAGGVEKTYQVQIDVRVEDDWVGRLVEGIEEGGDRLRARRARVLRRGSKTSWLEVVLDEGRNRQLRRMLEGLGVEVLRLVRVAIGRLELGDLPKGSWRHLTRAEVEVMSRQKTTWTDERRG